MHPLRAAHRLPEKRALFRTMASRIDTGDFQTIIRGLKEESEKRDTVIRDSRDIQRWSKQAIFSLHRREFEEAASRLDAAYGATSKLSCFIEEYPLLRLGAFANALEEYSEARIFDHYIRSGSILPMADLPFVNRDEYLGGVLDFTGELLRHAIQRATVRDVEAVTQARDLVQDLMGHFLKIDFRNTHLRKKFDALKYTLKKLENTLYELSLSKGGTWIETLDKSEEPADQDNY